MTIYGIGTDIVRIARMEDNIRRYGERFAERILTADELEEYRQSHQQARFLAKRFAAKEAMVKALGTGFSRGIGLRDIAVAHEPGGRPFLVCTGSARHACDERGITSMHLSITDEAEYALAFVVMERGGSPTAG